MKVKTPKEIREKKSRIAEKLKVRALNKKKKKQFSRSKLVKEADRVFSLYIRGRDSGKPCCTCGAKWTENFQAGHFQSRRHLILRWTETNCHGQCPKCNMWGGGEQFHHGVYIDELYGGLSAAKLSLTTLASFKVTDAEILETIQHYYRKCFQLGLDYKPKKQFLGN